MAPRAFDRRLRDGGRMVPTGPVRLDGNCSRSNLINGLWLLNGSALDLSGNGNNGTFVGSPTVGGSVAGPATILNPANNGTQYVSGGSAFNYTTSDFTLAVTLTLLSFTTNSAGQGPVVLFSGQYESAGYYSQIDSTGSVYFATNQSGAIQSSSTSAGAIAVGAVARIAYVRQGSTVTIYVNGVNLTTTSPVHSNPASSSQAFQLGAYNGTQICTQGTFSGFIAASRAWTPGEVEADASAPFSLLERAGRIAVWDVGASGGVPFSASAGLGSLLFAGDPLTAAAGASLSLGSGILDFTGLDSSPSAGASLIAGLGELILTGLPATVTIGGTPLQVTMGLGSLVTSGGAAAISAGAQISVGTGATQSAGESFAISAGVNLTASFGTILLSGQLPGVSAGANLTAGEQVLLLEGYPATVTTGAIPVAVTAGLGAIQFLGLQPTVSALANYAYTFTLPEDVLTATLPLDVLTVTLAPR